MKRCETQNNSVVKNMANFFATVFQGDHYVKMEKQAFCRVCNSQTEVVTAQDAFSDAKIA